jgi:hypothetical protein
MLKKAIMAIALAGAMCAGAAYKWENVESDRRVGGRMISEGYLRGKVVLIDRRDYGDPAQKEAVKQLQDLWATYKSKPFVLLGSHNGKSPAKRAGAALKKLGVTYPVYDDAWFRKLGDSDGEHRSIESARADFEPHIFVMDSTCRRRLYSGSDVRAATGAVGNALIGASTPMDAKQYGYLLEWEVENSPGRALLRLNEFRERFPHEAVGFDAAWKRLSGDAEVKKLAKLVELSRQVKDRDVADRKVQQITPELLEKAMEKFDSLKKSARPVVAQEAKNALADMKWSAAEISRKKR